MKLIHKLLLGYLVISSFGVLTTYIAIRSFHNVENTFDSLTKDVVPEKARYPITRFIVIVKTD